MVGCDSICRAECGLLDPAEHREILTAFSITDDSVSPQRKCDDDWTEADSACASSVTMSTTTLPQLEKHLEGLLASVSVSFVGD